MSVCLTRSFRWLNKKIPLLQSVFTYELAACVRADTDRVSVGCRRKRGEKGEVVETIEDVIVRRLTADRIEELKKLINETQEAHRFAAATFSSIKLLRVDRRQECSVTRRRLRRKLKREAELIQAGHLDSKLEEIWEEILR